MTFLNDSQKLLLPEDYQSLQQRLLDYQNATHKIIQVDINSSSPSSPSANQVIVSINTSQKSLEVNPETLKFLLPKDSNTYFQTKDYTGLVNETQENLINYLQDPNKYVLPKPLFQFQSTDIYLGLLVLISSLVWLTYFLKPKRSNSN